MSLTVAPTTQAHGIVTLFMLKTLAKMPVEQITRIATVITSDGPNETLGHLGDIPNVSEFLGSRLISGMSETTYTVTPSEYTGTVAFHRRDIDDDRSGMIAMRIDQLSDRAANHPYQLLIEKLVAGQTDLCYDGVSFFNDAHPIRGQQTAVHDNDIAGSGTSVANAKTDIGTCRSTVRRAKDEANQPFFSSRVDLSQSIILAPPEMEMTFREALNATESAGAGTNVFKGVAELWIEPLLTDTNDWIFLYVGDVLKPMLFIERVALEFEADDEGGDAFNNLVYKYGTYARYGAAYLFFQGSVYVTNS